MKEIGESGSGDSGELIPSHGGYRELRSFQVALVIYDATVAFCDRFIGKRSRTHDQMVQAARSGVQNIAEGSLASGTSKKTELKLTNVARASLGELLRDYEDYLRQHRLRQWDKNSPEAMKVRRKYVSDRSDGSDGSDKSDGSDDGTGEVVANTMICLINQAMYLLRRQLRVLEVEFLENGGFTERLYRRRSEVRQGVGQGEVPACPVCGKPMRRRVARQGKYTGQPFWGCTGWPACTGKRTT